MHCISAILFALSANMDNVAIGLSYGVKGVGIRFRSNLLIALLTSLGTLVSMVAGTPLTVLLPERVANSLGCALLISMGLWFVITSLHKLFHAKDRETGASSTEACEEWAQGLLHASEQNSALPQTSYISTRESLVLAIALMLNNLGFGIGAKIAGLPILITSGCTFLISVFLLSFGIWLGKHFGDTFLGKYTDLFSGFIIILLGMYELFS